MTREQHRMNRLFAFAHVLHMTPRDVDQLTVAEYDALAAGLDRYMDETRRAAADHERAAREAAAAEHHTRGGRRP